MKSAFVLATLLSISNAFGQDSQPSDSSKPYISEIEKLSYSPKEGIPYFSTALTYSTSKGSIKSQIGTVANFTTKATGFNYSVGYGLSNYLALGVSGLLPMNKQTEYDYGAGSTLNGTSSTYKTSGWQEPALGGVWRVRDNEESKMRIHLSGFVRPKLQSAKSATAASEGNNGIGGTQFNLGIGFFKQVKSMEFQLRVDRNFHSVAKYEDSSDSTKTSQADEHQSSNIRLGIQNMTSDILAIGGSLIFELEDKYSNSSYVSTTGITTTLDYDSASATSIELFAKYKFEESSLLQLRIQSLLVASISANQGTTKLDQKTDSWSSIDLSWNQEF